MSHVRKTRVPHPEKAKSLEDHLKAAEDMIAQIRAKHYIPVGDPVITRSDTGDSSKREHVRHFHFDLSVKDADPKAPAENHPLAK